MAFIKGHGFDGFTTAAEMATKLGMTLIGAPGYDTTAGRFGLGALNCSNNTRGAKWGFTSVGTKIIIQTCYEFYAINNGTYKYFHRLFNNGGVDTCLELQTVTGGGLRLVNAAGSTVTSVAGVLTTGKKHIIIVEAEIGAAAGTVRVWVDPSTLADPPKIDVSGVDLTDAGGGTCDAVTWNTDDANLNFYVSQTLIYDTDGAGDWSAYMGDKALYPLEMTADHTQEFGRSSGTENYSLVDDPITGSADGDSTHVIGTAAGTGDLYEFEDAPTGLTGVVGLLITAEMSKTDAGALPSSPVLQVRSGAGTIEQSSAITGVSETYAEAQKMFLVEPGGAAWTKAKIDASQVGPALPAV